MMKKEELRIGNLIGFKGDIDSVKELHLFNLSTSWFTIDYELCECLPITFDWLEKFGFKQNDDSNNWWNKEADCSIDAEPTIQPNAIEFLFYYRLTSERRKSLIYVHHLQNLYFALTGTELELKP